MNAWGDRKIAAWLLGGVLFFAGTLKLMDPVGTSLIVAEYFKFFKFHVLIPASWWTGFLLSLFETLLGAAIITGIRKKLCGVLSAALLAAFTAITALLWIRNPDMDCGCFGEAIHLTHKQTFFKNLILDALWAFRFIPFRKLEPAPASKKIAFGIVTASVGLYAVMFAATIPAIDFTSMCVGAELYRPDDFLPEDSPVVSICSQEGEYADSLLTHGNVFVVSSYDPSRIRARGWSEIGEALADAESAGLECFYLAPEFPENPVQELSGICYTSDRKTLMTLNRSNGGMTFICDGQIVRKWPLHKAPDTQKMAELLSGDPTAAMMESDTLPAVYVQGYLLIMFAIMLIL